MNVLIFGAAGQDGHYLRGIFEERGFDVIGASRSGSPVAADVADFEQVADLIREHRPEYVIHLAAASTTRHAAVFENHEAIATGTINVLEATSRHAPEARVFITGSGVQFENDGNPIDEQTPFQASSPYSIARIHSVYAARYYRSLGLRTFVGYLFHHESPRRKPSHVSKMIALAVQRIAGGSNETIELGDIGVTKEWTFAGDVARGIVTLMDQSDLHEAVIGSGKDYSIEQWLEVCFRLIGKDWRDHVRVREGFEPEYRRLVSNPVRMRDLGWAPSVDFEALANMMVNPEPGA